MQQHQQQAGQPSSVAQVFIGKVPQDVSVAALEAELAPYGATSVRALPGKGCAFADFPSWGAAERAIQSLNGFKLTADSVEGINVKFADQKGQPKGREGRPKVFIGSLAPTINDEMLYQTACQFGSIQEVKVFQKSPDAPPCGFVLYSSFAEAENCIGALHGVENELSAPGKTLNVKFAEHGGHKPAPGPVVGGMPMSHGMHGGHVARAFVGHAPPVVPMPPPVPQQQRRVAARPPPMAPQPMMHHNNGGYGGGCYPGVVGGGKGGHMPMQQASAPRGGVVGQPVGNAGGRPSPGGPGSMPPPANCSQKLFVGSLPAAANEDFVWGLMAPYGEVIEAKIHRKNGVGTPCGFVRFLTTEDAEQAIMGHAQLGKFTVKYADENRGGAGAKRSFNNAFGGDPNMAWT